MTYDSEKLGPGVATPAALFSASVAPPLAGLPGVISYEINSLAPLPLPTYLLPEFYILWPRLIGLAGPPRELRSRLFRCIDSSSRSLVRSMPFPFRIRKRELAISAIGNEIQV